MRPRFMPQNVRLFQVSDYGVYQAELEYPSAITGSSKREDENTVFKELVPMLAWVNLSGAGFSPSWSSDVRHSCSLWPALNSRALGTTGIL